MATISNKTHCTSAESVATVWAVPIRRAACHRRVAAEDRIQLAPIIGLMANTHCDPLVTAATVVAVVIPTGAVPAPGMWVTTRRQDRARLPV